MKPPYGVHDPTLRSLDYSSCDPLAVVEPRPLPAAEPGESPAPAAEQGVKGDFIGDSRYIYICMYIYIWGLGFRVEG